ncbi:hypothetical protein [Pseudomonas sp. 2FG]|uniref:hypothetical protein n=1 Tax=Pseudomonas sp. 2FG TaxID=2502191 RepID=UPI0010F4B73B|nr:hypothetical protein [Pseudomonas sp. 2FG]
MIKAKDKRAWVTRTDVSAWAMTYLQHRCARVPDSPPAKELYEQLHQIHTLKGSTDKKLKELLETMQAAWRKQKSRDKQTGKKPHNFNLSEEAGRQLSRLSADYGETKTHTLEMIISDSLARENRSKAERKDEGVFKKRAAIFEHQLDQALDELHEYKLRLSQAEVDITIPLDTEQQKKVNRLSRARKKEVRDQLPPLPANMPKKKTPAKKVFIRRSQTKPAPLPSTKATVNTSQIVEQEHNATSGTQAQSLREKPHEAGGEISQSPENGMTVTPEENSSAEQKLKNALTANQADSDSTSVLATPLTNFNEHVSVQIDIDAPSADTPLEELTTHKKEHSESPVTPAKSLDESSFKASSKTSPEQISAMTTIQDASSTAPTLQELAASVRTAIDAGAQDKRTSAQPVDNRPDWQKKGEEMRAINRRDIKR